MRSEITSGIFSNLEAKEMAIFLTLFLLNAFLFYSWIAFLKLVVNALLISYR